MSEHRPKPPHSQGDEPSAASSAAEQSNCPAPSGDTAPQTPSDSHEARHPNGEDAEDGRTTQPGGDGLHEEANTGDDGSDGGRGGDGGKGSGNGREGDPGKARRIDYPRHNKYGWRRWVPSWKLVTGLCLGFIGSLMAAATIAYAVVEVPDPNRASEAQNNVYYWADGTQMAATGGEINRQIIPISQIPEDMQNAVISAENKTFRTDSGVDPMGIGRALVNMAKGGQTQGGSTITQQYVKNARLGDQSQTFSRKFKELIVSVKVGAKMGKPDIMAGYLNASYYGRDAYGLQAAARTYYGIDAKDLNTGQCAFLASLLRDPVHFDPAGSVDIDPAATPEANTARVTERWNWILDEMLKDGHLPAAERVKYKNFPMPRNAAKNGQLSGQVGYLVDLAKSYFLSTNDQGIGADDLARGGYEIHTTFQKDKVDKLKAAVKKVQDANIKPKKRPDTDTFVQFGGASVNPKTGEIAAVYGGEDATKHFTNGADETGAQVGSAFKPFVLAAAMETGVRDPLKPEDQGLDDRKLVDPDKSVYNGKNKLKIKKYDGSVWTNEKGEEWLQTNDGGESYKNITLREAMVHSANSPFVQLGMDIGIPEVRKSAVKAGLLESSLSKSNVPSFSIGISSPSAIRMAGAYATFAANGKQRDPFSVKKVEHEGRTVYEHEDRTKQAFTTAVASNVTDVLRSVVDEPEGTGKNARLPGRQVAGKTGTTDGNKSAWFVGYTPQLSTAIDMYRLDDNEKNKNRAFLEMYGTGGQDKIHGASFPSEIWQTYMSEALKGQPVMNFPAPEPIRP
ncbi:penicillin-binding protein [Streptomyces sp. NBC_01210]|uniref:transglycosylase domain-containing protein n=1 Tax=Streptomyces sp. NBC_01210 TaxID=2903774 RepID=UPI002E1243C2|nr:penicillin-binding protein [Streptomyces sp. NBC_01210]